MRILRLYKEIRNYITYKNIVKRESMDSPKWSRFKLRVDWINRIYTVVNLPPEVTKSTDFPEEGRPAYVMEEISKINDYLGIDLNLSEVITVGMEPIKGTDSYLVYWFFLFRELTILYIMRLLIILGLVIFSILEWKWIYSISSEYFSIASEKIINLF